MLSNHYMTRRSNHTILMVECWRNIIRMEKTYEDGGKYYRSTPYCTAHTAHAAHATHTHTHFNHTWQDVRMTGEASGVYACGEGN